MLRVTRSTRSTTSMTSASSRSSTIRSCPSILACRSSRRRTSARSWTPSTTCPTCCGRSPTSPRAAGWSTRRSPTRSGWRALPNGETRPAGSTGSSTSSSGTRPRTATNPIQIGMTMQFPVADQTRVNDPLFASRADWISPGYDDDVFAGGGHPMAPGSPQSHWLENPPPADGHKVMITDTDHYAPGRGDALWAWKSFVRGHHPILMDFGLISGVDEPDPAFAAARFAMGDTRGFAERLNLLAMTPRGELTSTGLRAGAPRLGVPRPRAGGRQRSVHRGARTRRLLHRVVQRHRPGDDYWRVDDGRACNWHELPSPCGACRGPRSCTSSGKGRPTDDGRPALRRERRNLHRQARRPVGVERAHPGPAGHRPAQAVATSAPSGVVAPSPVTALMRRPRCRRCRRPRSPTVTSRSI